jgi:hypothetical protein
MIFDRILCAIGLIVGLFTTIYPLNILKMQNTIRSAFLLKELEISDFKIFIYRAIGIFEILIFTLFLIQTFTI